MNYPRLSVLPCLAGALALAFAVAAYAQPAAGGETVLIGFKQKPGPAEEAVVRASGGSVKHTFQLIPAISARLPQAALNGLRNHPLVSIIETDTEVYAIDAELDNTWGVKQIGAGAVHDAANFGAGVKVCVIDTGIDYNHPDLAGRYEPAGSWDYVNADSDPFDDNGHGTHVAGTIAANDNGVGVVGVAPSARIIALKILGKNGSGSFIDAASAVDRCFQNGGKITNNSYGSTSDPGAQIQQVFDNAYAQGVLHVAAAGNSGRTGVGYPARYNSVIAVAATDRNNVRASFSSTGPEVELSAPGVSINSTVPGGGYASYSGTSMASPHVAGTAALVITSGLTGATDIRQRLTSTAQDLGPAGRDQEYGFGLVRADVATGVTPAPVASPPNPPSNLTAAASGTTVNLAWQDNSTDETGFVIERCKVNPQGACSFSELATVGSNINTYADSAPKKSTLKYRVKARNSAGDSAYSNEVTVTTK